ncbi:MAG: hemolysin III family protein [Hyphomicrobiales bacterium]|nr:MAG: hemolysin III family protein [Hyphomicrobiales bacterium]
MTSERSVPARSWWHPRRRFSLAEIIADGVVHGIGLVVALSLGTLLIVFAAMGSARTELPAIILYVVTLLTVLGVSLAFNLAGPMSALRRVMARLDQAAIFLLIAGTYTPFLAVIGGTPAGQLMTVLVWGAALVGMALKLIVPERFGRLAILLYLGIGWSGVLVFQTLVATLPAMTMWLIVAGGIAYSAGIIFHLWDRLKFQNVLWHIFVVAGASLHLWAIFHCMVVSRL